MGINDEIKGELRGLGINPVALSKNEEGYIEIIYNEYKRFEKDYLVLKEKLKNLKFNKTTLLDRQLFAKQTLYNNPSVKAYEEYCEAKAEKLSVFKVKSEETLKMKIKALKDENMEIVGRSVDVAIKEEEIKTLSRELQDRDRKIESLRRQIEELRNENKRLLKKMMS